MILSYCKKCGSRLQRRFIQSGKYNSRNGEAIYHKYNFCPNGTSFLGFGHTQFYDHVVDSGRDQYFKTGDYQYKDIYGNILNAPRS